MSLINLLSLGAIITKKGSDIAKLSPNFNLSLRQNGLGVILTKTGAISPTYRQTSICLWDKNVYRWDKKVPLRHLETMDKSICLETNQFVSYCPFGPGRRL
jgi:hypothetical protein